MAVPHDSPLGTPVAGATHDVLAALLDATTHLPPSRIGELGGLAARALDALDGRLLVADYAFSWLAELRADGSVGDRQPVEGTMAGRALISGQLVTSESPPGRVWVALNEGSERVGVLELDGVPWSEPPALLDLVVRVMVLVLISKRRYTDAVLRTRRTEPLSIAAELQWDLLPPLTCATDRVAVSGILEPAYSIGGDSFDYALNDDRADFAIVDAVGHGMPAVMMSVTAINSMRNARREGVDLDASYLQTGRTIEAEFGNAAYVTAQLGSLDLRSGRLRWLNAGHPLPLIVRDGRGHGELSCRPSLPMGLGGPVVEIADEHLQRGDRVLFFTDGVTETRAPDGTAFGVPRLQDYLVRVTLEGLAPAEAVRRLRTLIMDFNGAGLSDDATLLLIDFHGAEQPGGE